jgi:hypothetical protein
MLFDLRSKSRRNTVRVVYVILALLMLSGLLLVGVGTGNNNGGILNALSNNGGSTSGQNALINQATSAAIKQTNKHPDSSKAWAGLVEARWTAAGTGTNFDTTTNTYTKGGKAQLNDGVTAWTKYLSLVNSKPDLNTSLFAVKIYQALQQWSDAGNAWEYIIQSQGAGSADAIRGYECLALNAFAASQTSKGELAAAAAKKRLPKVDQAQWASTVTSAKSSATTAAGDVASDC